MSKWFRGKGNIVNKYNKIKLKMEGLWYKRDDHHQNSMEKVLGNAQCPSVGQSPKQKSI